MGVSLTSKITYWQDRFIGSRLQEMRNDDIIYRYFTGFQRGNGKGKHKSHLYAPLLGFDLPCVYIDPIHTQ